MDDKLTYEDVLEYDGLFGLAPSFMLENPIKENAYFFGWYDNEHFTGDSINHINTFTTGNIKLYAKFLVLNDRIYIVNAYELSGSDLSVITDPFTLKIIGSISTNTLREKLLEAVSEINLDLSETTLFSDSVPDL